MALTLANITPILEALVEKYPNRLPTASITVEQLNRLLGQQEVIKHLYDTIEAIENKRK